MNPNKETGKASRALGAGLCLITILAVCYFIAFPMRGFYNSDYADTLTWAKASVDAGALFSSDFTYACLLPFGGQLLMIPFVWLFGFSYTAHACGMIAFFLLLAVALRAFFRALGADTLWSSVCLLCVVGPLCSSEKLREVYFGHILYYSLGALFLLVGMTLYLTMDKDKDSKFSWRFAAFCVWCVLCSTDGLTSLSLFVLPLCAGIAFERLCDRKVKFLSEENFLRCRPLLYALCFSVLGLGLGALLRRGFSAPYQEAFSTFSADTDWGNNMLITPSSFLSLFTGPVALYQDLTSFAGILAALRILFGLLVLAAPIAALFFFKHLHRGEKLLLIAHFTVSATMLFAFIFGLLSNAEWRLSPMLFTALLSTVCFFRRLSLLPFFKRFGLLLLAFCVLIAGLGLFEVVKMPADNSPSGSAAALTNYLNDAGCTYGYASFWDANAITVLSGDKIRCRNIEVSTDSGLVTPAFYQSEHAWYNGQGSGEVYFLLLTNEEFSYLNQAELSGILSIDHYQNHVLLLLSHDIFPKT